MFKICVGNYGYYNEGILRDKWVELPMQPAELQSWLESNGLYDAMHEETYISDTDGVPRWARKALKMCSVDQTNVLATLASGLSDYEEAAIECAYDAIGCFDLEELCNLILQAYKIPFIEMDTSRAGEQFADEMGLTAELERLGVTAYFDFDAFGEACLEDFYYTEYGFLSGDIPDTSAYAWDEILIKAGYEVPDEDENDA